MKYELSVKNIPAFQKFSIPEIPSRVWVETHRSFSDLESLFQALPENGLAIVGTRYPQARSIELINKVFAQLRTLEGRTIISGYARGIDSHAHSLAVENKFITIAVLGCGLDQNYPSGQALLRKKILESGGVLLTEYVEGTPPLSHHFLKRNRLIAGLAKATWVVEAAEPSGSLNTATWASKLNRDLYATPAFPGDPSFSGTERLLNDLQTTQQPRAIPFYNASTLAHTWTEWSSQTSLFPEFKKTTQDHLPIQAWIRELKTNGKNCSLQALLDWSCIHHGHSPGEFFKQYEKALIEKAIRVSPAGQVDLA